MVSPPQMPKFPLTRAEYDDDIAQHVTNALAAYEKADFDAALDDWNKAVLLAPQDGRFYLARGLLFLRMGRSAEALQDFDLAVSLSVPADMEADLQSARANALYKIGRVKEALALLDTAIEATGEAELRVLRALMVAEQLKALVDDGFASWSGERPRGSKNPVSISDGPPVSDYVVQDRR